MAYSYYQSSGAPGWGTQQFRFGAPPVPTFQPQPSWGGLDYYRAHADSPDASYYTNAWNRIRDTHDPTVSYGVGLHEARHWHRRVYGGLININELLPAEIGHAAAYEAYRTWQHNSFMYEPISDDPERQREGLVGLAVAESSRLLHHNHQGMDSFARRTAADAAAATANNLFYEGRNHTSDEYRGRTMGSSYSGSAIDDPYAVDASWMYPHMRGRSHSRHRSLHRPLSGYGGSAYGGSAYGGSPSIGGSSIGSHSPLPIPGAMSSVGAGYQGGGVGFPGSYGNQVPYAGSYGGQPGSYGGSYGSYGSEYAQPGYPVGGSGYGMNQIPGVVRPRSHSFNGGYPASYAPQTGAYPGAYPGAYGGVPAQQQPTIIIKKERRHHRRRSSSRHSHRHRY